MSKFSMFRTMFKDQAKMFGFWSSLSFCFRWDVIDPIKMWYWEAFQTRKWCTNAGWYCTKGKDCPFIHYKHPNKAELERMSKIPFGIEFWEEEAKIEHYIRKKGKKWNKVI